MIINFRQGIVSYDTSISPFTASSSAGGIDITLNVGTQPFVLSIANKTANYLWNESLTIDAWPSLSPTGTYWLYFDFNSKTFARTFGTTTLRPVVQSTAPSSPAVGQHWYNIATSQMFVWSGTSWNVILRVFVANFVGPSTFISMSINAPSFQGTTIGDTTANVSAGRVLVDSSGYPIIKHDGTFFTTEDQSFAQGSAINGIRLESNVFTAQSASQSIIPVYEVVAFNQDGTIRIASYNDAGPTAIALALQQINFAGTGAVLLEGTVTNPLWNWSGQIGSLLWVSGDNPGTLQDTDPYLDNPVVYQIQRVPVARVIGPTSIIFLQGIGTKGDPGPSGGSSGSFGLYNPTSGGLILTTDGITRSVSSSAKLSLLLPSGSGLTQDATGLYIGANSVTNSMLVNSSVPLDLDGAGTTTMTLGSVFKFFGTANQITTTASAGTVTFSLAPIGTPGTYTSVTTDSTGRVISGSSGGGAFLPLAGGTMSGIINMGTGSGNTVTRYQIQNLATPASSFDAANKQYVDNTVSSSLGAFLPLAGGTMTGVISMGSTVGNVFTTYNITNLADPVGARDAVTKQYVDTALYNGKNYDFITGVTGTTVTLTYVTATAASGAKAYVQIFKNGTLQREGGTVSVTSSTQLTFTTALITSDQIEVFQL